MQDEIKSKASRAEKPQETLGFSSVAPPIALFSLYTFALMSTGVQCDAALAGSGIDGLTYNLREGLLLVGFVLYGVVAWRRPRFLSGKKARVFRVLLALAYVASAMVVQMASLSTPLVIAVLAMSLSVGFLGGSVYEKVALFAAGGPRACLKMPNAKGGLSSRDAATRMLGLIIGVGGALAVVVQYLLQLQLSLGEWFMAPLVVGYCITVWLVGADVRERDEASMPSESTGAPTGALVRKQVLILAVVVVCLFGLFVFCEAVVRNEFAWLVFYQWHRLFLAAGYLIIGTAAFLGGRPVVSLVVVVVALFTAFVHAQTALMQVDNFTMAMFYTLLGAVVAYSGVAFMSLGPLTEHPALVASGSRMIEGAVTIVGGMAASLISGWPVSAVLFMALALIALTIILMVAGRFFAPSLDYALRDANRQSEEEAPDSENGRTEAAEEAHVAASEEALPVGMPDATVVAERYSLTRRETEVLALIFRDLTVQEIADELVVTKSTAKFHVTNILKKTGSQTRQYLVQKLSR